MNYIDDWSLYNQKNILKAKEFVEDNLLRLVQFFDLKDSSSEDEKKQMVFLYSVIIDVGKDLYKKLDGCRIPPQLLTISTFCVQAIICGY